MRVCVLLTRFRDQVHALGFPTRRRSRSSLRHGFALPAWDYWAGERTNSNGKEDKGDCEETHWSKNSKGVERTRELG